jgi:3-oxoacyl-[acyl-carrier protein] reductase
MVSVSEKRVVIVTGSSRGLGKEIALAFGRAGDAVVVNFLTHESEAASVTDEIIRAGGEAIYVRADIRLTDHTDALINAAHKRWGKIDAIVNNAATTKDGLILRMTEEEWDDVLDTNLKGAFYCIRSSSKILMKQRKGHIINIASIVGVQGREGQANYSASKAGLIGLTKAVAKELGPFNIQVNAVLPGYLPTDMGSSVSDTVQERIMQQNALGRTSTSKEVSDFVYYLARMDNVSGQVFNLDSRVL